MEERKFFQWHGPYGTFESFELHRRVRDACSNFTDKITENQSKKQKRYDSKMKEDFRNLFCYLTSTCCFSCYYKYIRNHHLDL